MAEDLNKWTVAEFKSVENDLKEKRKRREEIPVEIRKKEQEINQLNQQITEDLKQMENLQKKEARLASQAKSLESSYSSASRYAGEELAFQRQQTLAVLKNVRNSLKDIQKEHDELSSEIAKNEETIRRLELEIANLKSEDQKIINECKDYINTFRDVEESAQKAIKSHQGASTAFTKAANVTRFGNTKTQAGKNLSDKIIKNFEDKRAFARMLAQLASVIIGIGENISLTGTADVSADSGTGANFDLMKTGYASVLETPLNNAGRFPTNPDGSTNFESVAGCTFVLPSSISTISAKEIDEAWGTQRHITAEDAVMFRNTYDLAWRVEGSSVYLIEKKYVCFGSDIGTTLDEWDSVPKTRWLKK